METRHNPLLSMAVFLLTIAPCHAGPCSKQIEELQIQIDAKLNAAAAAGPAGDETTAATDHRQPTPKSIAAAEVKLGTFPKKLCEQLEKPWPVRARPTSPERRPVAKRPSRTRSA